jgi:hypothetical protein
MVEKLIRTYIKRISAAESCSIEIYLVPGGYSFAASVMVKWQGFGSPCMADKPEYVFSTKEKALEGAVKYIRYITGNCHNYTPEQKKVVEKMLPNVEQKDFF